MDIFHEDLLHANHVDNSLYSDIVNSHDLHNQNHDLSQDNYSFNQEDYSFDNSGLDSDNYHFNQEDYSQNHGLNYDDHFDTQRLGSQSPSAEDLKKAQEEQKLANEADKSSEWNQKQADYFNTHDSSSIANSYTRDSIEQKEAQEKHQANADKLRNPS
jgi:hypothetical protein